MNELWIRPYIRSHSKFTVQVMKITKRSRRSHILHSEDSVANYTTVNGYCKCIKLIHQQVFFQGILITGYNYWVGLITY